MENTRGQIYCIRNNLTQKYYVGCSTTYSSQRFNKIVNGAYNNNWGGGNLSELQKDILILGKENFSFMILDKGISDITELYKMETDYILEFKNKGYALYNKKLNDKPENHRQTPSSIEKIKASRAKLIYTNEIKLKIKNSKRLRA